MNYQQTKTIQKHSINKNLLLLGLLVFASFAQACGGGKKTNKTGDASVNTAAIQAVLGEWQGFNAKSFEVKVGQDAKDCKSKKVTVDLAKEQIESLKLPKEIKLVNAEDPSITDNVPYFKAFGKKVVKGDGKVFTGTKLEEDGTLSGLFKEVLGEFSDNNKDKNAKVFVLVKLLELEEKVKTAKTKEKVQQAVSDFKNDIAKISPDANGVLVVISDEGTLAFKPLTQEDKTKLTSVVNKTCKYTIDKELYEFIETKVVSPIEKAAAEL